MARRRPGAGQAMTALEELQAKMARKRELLDQIGQAHDAGNMGEVERLWAEVDALYPQGEPLDTA